MLAETAGAVALNRKERVKQPGLVHASERLVCWGFEGLTVCPFVNRWASVFVLISVWTVGLREPHGVRCVFVLSVLPLGCGSLCVHC